MQVNVSPDLWKQTLSVATAFWALCLVLVIIEATFGDNLVTGALFFLSVPALVGFLLWANKTVLVLVRRGFFATFALGVYLLASATVIVFIGLFAAANLKHIMVGA